MSNRKQIQQEAFVTLVNKQLEPFNKTYEDIKEDPRWYVKYVVTPKQEEAFCNWGVQYLKNKFNFNDKQAEMEMDWFILQWGLKSNKVVNTAQSIEETNTFINKLKRSK